MTISLINATRRIKIYNLPHQIYCRALGHCACMTSGDRMLSSSLTILAGATVTGIEEAVLHIPEVKRDIRKSLLRVRREKSNVDKPPAEKPKQKSSRKKGR